MAFCANCGNEISQAGVCPACGTISAQQNPPGQNYSPPQGPPPPNYSAPPPPPQQGYAPPQQGYAPPRQGYGQPQYDSSYAGARGEYAIVRSPGICILLSIVTCGVYYLYWLWVTHKQINDLAGAEVVGSGMIILGWFCTPVLWYDWYKWDLELQSIASRRYLPYSSNFILWLLLSIFVGVGSMIMIFQVQDLLNRVYGNA